MYVQILYFYRHIRLAYKRSIKGYTSFQYGGASFIFFSFVSNIFMCIHTLASQQAYSAQEY